MNAIDLALLIFVACAALSGGAMLFSRQPLTCALFLIACLVSIAVIYLLLNAEFLAVTQLMIYAAGVVVLIIFGIMLTARTANTTKSTTHRNTRTGMALAVTVMVILLVIARAYATELDPVSSFVPHPVGQVGLSLFTFYTVAFEAAGMLLLVSLIAAVVLASHHPSSGNHDS